MAGEETKRLMGDSLKDGRSPLRLHQSFARSLGIEIVSGRIAPGDNLGGEIERSAALGISRTAYREAIRILIAKGLVESRPKAGTHVSDRKRWNLLDPDILEWMFHSDPDEKFVNDLFELRRIVEPAAAVLAAQRCTDGQLAEMDEALARMKQYGLSTEVGRLADQRFHTLILEAAANEPLSSLSSTIGAAVHWTTRFKLAVQDNPRDPYLDHLALRNAIASRDVEMADAAMRELINLALDDMAK